MAKKPEKQPTPLEYAILGLAAARPQTGYEICRLFEETPISVYSSSPGSIYPAIRRLRAAGLIADAPHPDNPQGSKKALRITADGVATLRAWLSAPVGREDVERRMEELMLRFAFMSGNVSRAVIARFLTRLKTEIDAHVGRLASYAETASPHMPASGALALDAGIGAYRDRARWAARALQTIEEQEAGRAPAKRRGAA
ncbi:MAG: PadR family transcriptional regulator [Oricola sp.]|jgi:DNA-binding PadR family transcriptional regulator|nr:PadR family transcriptional regulator [Oricola sp.]